jgi:hypothetical protein
VHTHRELEEHHQHQDRLIDPKHDSSTPTQARGLLMRARIRAPSMARLSPSRQQGPYTRDGAHCPLTSSLRMAVPLLTTTSRRSPPFTWSSACVVVCRSSSRPSLERRLVFSHLAASLTSFPLEESSHEKSLPRTTSLYLTRQVSASHEESPPRTTSLRLTQQVRLRLVRGPRRTTLTSPSTRAEEQISTSHGSNNWRPCRRPTPARALMQV